LCQLFQFLTKLRLGRCTHQLINELTILEKEQGRHSPDLVMTGGAWMEGGVEGTDLDPAQIFPV
jgi:hypothetical protein